MYTTIEADIDNGMICGRETSKLPTHAHVLITLLPSSLTNQKPNWATIEAQLGRLTLRKDTVQWQRSVREEW
jgi:hypothetical protein